jgi:hypothetical protein
LAQKVNILGNFSDCGPKTGLATFGLGHLHCKLGNHVFGVETFKFKVEFFVDFGKILKVHDFSKTFPINTTVNCPNRQLPKNCREIDIVAEIGQLTAICPKSLPYVSHNFAIKVSCLEIDQI